MAGGGAGGRGILGRASGAIWRGVRGPAGGGGGEGVCLQGSTISISDPPPPSFRIIIMQPTIYHLSKRSRLYEFILLLFEHRQRYEGSYGCREFLLPHASRTGVFVNGLSESRFSHKKIDFLPKKIFYLLKKNFFEKNTHAAMLFDRGQRSIDAWYFIFSICFFNASLSMAARTLESISAGWSAWGVTRHLLLSSSDLRNTSQE